MGSHKVEVSINCIAGNKSLYATAVTEKYRFLMRTCPATISTIDDAFDSYLSKAIVAAAKPCVVAYQQSMEYLHFNCWYARAHFKTAYQQWRKSF
jgi:hypothetical protein